MPDEQDLQMLYAGRFIQMVKRGRWEYATRTGHASAVGVIALTPAGELLIVEQQRIPVGTSVLELPAGLVGDEAHLAGEEIIAAAKRELLEETGYEAAQWEYLFGGPSSAGLTDELVHLVLASDLRRTGPGGGVPGENITVHAVRVDALDAFLQQRIAAGALVDLKIRLAQYYLKWRKLA